MTPPLPHSDPMQHDDTPTIALHYQGNEDLFPFIKSPQDDTPAPLITHLIELRKRLMYCTGVFFSAFAISYFFSKEIFEFLVSPLSTIMQDMFHTLEGRRLIYTGLTEAFLTYIKVALFTAFLITFPFFALHLWSFIAPGLYHQEKRVFLPFLILTPFLFFIGAAFAYYIVFPKAYAFFLSFESPATHTMLAIQLEAKVNEYLGFVMRLILAFGICFELPVVLSLLGRAGFVTSKGLMEKWRIAVVSIFAVAAFLTPPDVLSMIALALPLIVLYSIAIFMVKLIEKK